MNAAAGPVVPETAFAAARPATVDLSAEVYELIRDFIYRETGIHLGDRKQSLVLSRLRRRVDLVTHGDFREYYRLIASGPSPERQFAIDRLTTNETHFFREPAHYRWFGAELQARASTRGKVRIWSAASSTGEEAYSLAMVCMDRLGGAARFEIYASDVSQGVVETARRGVYPLEQAQEIPDYYRRRYCLRGVRSMAAYFRMDPTILSAVRFERGNLLDCADVPGAFDYIFLRNVMIYFDRQTKEKVVANLSERLLPGACLITGHSESLQGISTGLERVQPSIYRRAKNVS
ncbi:MAG: protein-glutamate O-methyltransferase CheR [bacterium]|nr:protein-glutamate O-methyltransferase CheR [bacterium]